MYRKFAIVFMLAVNLLQADLDETRFKFEGVFGSPVAEINNMNRNANFFLPYNPVIVEVGAFEGAGTLELAKKYRLGKIYAIEPQVDAFEKLALNLADYRNVKVYNIALGTTNKDAFLYGVGPEASLLAFLQPSNKVKVPCVVLDDWCKKNEIDHIDFLRLDAGGLELQILKSSPEIFKTVIVLVTKTHLKPSAKNSSFAVLKGFLESKGFILLSHWYEEKVGGEAVFIPKYMYDAIFN